MIEVLIYCIFSINLRKRASLANKGSIRSCLEEATLELVVPLYTFRYFPPSQWMFWRLQTLVQFVGCSSIISNHCPKVRL